MAFSEETVSKFSPSTLISAQIGMNGIISTEEFQNTSVINTRNPTLLGFYEIVNSDLYKRTLKTFLGEVDFEVIKRPACYIIRPRNEGSDYVKRIIMFPPHGFTADEIFLLNPHPEARSARVKILGRINPSKKGFRPLVSGVKFCFSLTKSIPTEVSSPYARFSDEYCCSQLKSWKNWFFVVKENGWGNFHSLINLTNEWVLALLEKSIVDSKLIEIQTHLQKLHESRAEQLQDHLREIERLGDNVFENRVLIEEVLDFPPEIIVPILFQMLNVQETGKHEPCTFFALLLKFSRKDRSIVLKELAQAIQLKLAPHYYLNDLSRKLGG